MTKVAINAVRVSRQGGGGIDHYIIHLVNSLAKIGKEFDLFTLSPHHFRSVPPHQIIHPFTLQKFSGENRQLYRSPNRTAGEKTFSLQSPLRSFFAKRTGDFVKMAWTQFFLPFYLRQKKYEVVLSPSQWDAIALLDDSIQQIITVHDLIPFLFPEQAHKHAFFLRKVLPSILQKNVKIIAVSNNTKKDLVQMFNLNPQKITVIYEARPEFGTPVETVSSHEIDRLKNKYGLNKYLLSISGNHPHKNLKCLISAFAMIQPSEVSLAIAGYQDPLYQTELTSLAEEKKCLDKIKFLGHLPDRELPALYCGAEAFIFPSLYEGFGFPPLEALGYGLPLIVSNSSSLPEIAESAALYFDPKNPGDLAEKISLLLTHPELRLSLQKQAKEQVKKFSWKKTAQATWELIEHSSVI